MKPPRWKRAPSTRRALRRASRFMKGSVGEVSEPSRLV
jgi:hypothetical protein